MAANILRRAPSHLYGGERICRTGDREVYSHCWKTFNKKKFIIPHITLFKKRLFVGQGTEKFTYTVQRDYKKKTLLQLLQVFCKKKHFFWTYYNVQKAVVFTVQLLTDQNNRTKYFFCNLRKVDNSNKWKNYVIVTRVKLSVKLDALVLQSIFI